MTRCVTLCLLLPVALLFGGCATHSTLDPAPRPALSGVVHGGQQPISGAIIQLYAVGTSGDGSAATPLIASTVLTDAGGNFNISSDYTCQSSSTQVYLVATGGDPSPGIANPQIALMAALGSCGNYSSSSFISINELTTVAGVYALAPYMTSLTSVGSAAYDAPALASAFTLASELVNIGSGTAPGVNVPSGLTVPIAQVDTIADIVAACINSAGGISGDTNPCGQFFALTLPSGTTPSTNTISALLNLANNPALGTQALYNLPLPASPFQPTDPTQPTDFSINLTPAAPSVLTLSTPQLYVPSNGNNVITLTNTGATSISISSFATSTGFSQTNNCGANLALSASCIVTVGAAKTTQTPFNGTLTITSSASATQQVINLITAANVINFGDSTVGYPAGSTVSDPCYLNSPGFNSNYCVADPTIGGTDPGDFPGTLCVIREPGTCTGYVNFVPTAAGYRFATFVDPANYYPNAESLLVGFGIPSTGQVISYSTSSATLNMGTGIGTTPPPATLTLTNTGNQPVTLGISVSGQYGNAPPYPVFAQTNTCNGSLAIGATCTITVSAVSVPGLGPFGGILTITSNSLTPVVNIPVGGTVVQAMPAVSFSPSSSVTLASVPAGTPSTAQTVTLTNTGNVPLSIAVGPYSSGSPSQFTFSTTCGSSVPVNGTCTITVNGTPPAAGQVSSSLTVAPFGGGISLLYSIGVSVTGTAPPSYSVSTTSVTIPGSAVGTPGGAQSFTLTNTGSGTVSLSSIAYSIPGTGFTESDNCAGAIAYNSSCTVTVNATPSAVGPLSDTLVITSSNAGTQNVTVNATGYPAATNLVLSNSTQYVPYPGSATIYATNTGSSPITISAISAASPFAQASTCLGVLAPLATCTINVAAPSTTAVETTGSLTIISNDVVLTQTVTLVTAPAFSEFGPVIAGTSTPPQQAFYIAYFYSVIGRAALAPVSGLNASNFSFPGNTVCYDPSAPCSVTVQFAPTTAGYQFDVLNVTDASGSYSELLVGDAVPATFSSAQLAFPATALNTTATQQFTIANPLAHLLKLAIAAGATGNFQVSPSTCATTTCTITVSYSPTVFDASQESASLIVVDAALNQTIFPAPTFTGATGH